MCATQSPKKFASPLMMGQTGATPAQTYPGVTPPGVGGQMPPDGGDGRQQLDVGMGPDQFTGGGAVATAPTPPAGGPNGPDDIFRKFRFRNTGGGGPLEQQRGQNWNSF